MRTITTAEAVDVVDNYPHHGSSLIVIFPDLSLENFNSVVIESVEAQILETPFAAKKTLEI